MPGDTLADVIAANETLFVNCGHPVCSRSVKLDLKALAARLGADHGAMHNDLVGLFYCKACESQGRGRRPVFFTCTPDYAGHQRNWEG